MFLRISVIFFYNFKSVIKSQKENIENLTTQLNTLNNQINSIPIKKQSLEISNLEQDLINKKLKAQILEKELRYDYNAIQENKELKEQIKALQLIGKENINQQIINTAKSRIHNQLSYKLGNAFLKAHKYRFLGGYIWLLFEIRNIIKEKNVK